jgi:hypothetical protein
VRSADGKFALRALAPGRYELSADSREGEGKRIVEVRAGEAMKNLEIMLQPKARVRGIVLADDGTPLVGANVQVSRISSDDDAHAFDPPPVYTDEQGRFEITNAPVGAAWLNVNDAAHYIPMTELSLRSGEVQEVELRAHRYGTDYEIHGLGPE